MFLDYRHTERLPAPELIRWAIETFGDKLAILTSFQSSGMVILDMAAKIASPLRVLSLDTGRLPEETHQMMEVVRDRYGILVETVLPDASEVERMTRRYGPNLFYHGVELRKLCCEVRKVRPLKRKLREFNAWVTGLRREQSESRTALRRVEEQDGRLKLCPLADWTRQQIEEYIRLYDVPRHPLYAEGYRSIGCAPCTRPTQPEEDERAGRWWWEQDTQKECGIHFTPEGRVQQGVDVTLSQILRGVNA